MRTIALVPVRNEAWVLPHSLACLSGFCDAIIVSDQQSTDGTREICRQFPKVRVLDTPATSGSEQTTGRLPQPARWRLLDAAREFDGENLLWISDADELVPPRLAARWIDQHAAGLTPGTVIECLFYNLWNGPSTYREDDSLYRPHWKPMAFVDDRRADYPRSETEPLHEPRLPLEHPAQTLKADSLPVLHLQWLIAERNQMKQAWYRCIELLDGRTTAAAINRRYSITLPAPSARTTRVPPEWVEGVTFPDFSIDAQPAWHEHDVFAWFDRDGIERFEPLEIWHVKKLGDEFRRRTGRRPRPDRSYIRPWRLRARDYSRQKASAAWRRIFT